MKNINNTQDEDLLLSVLFNYPEKIELIPDIRPEMFANVDNKKIFSIMKEQETFDPDSIVLEYAKSPLSVRISAIYELSASSAFLDRYAKAVKRRFAVKSAVEIMNKTVKDMLDQPDDFVELLESAQIQLIATRDEREEIQIIDDVVSTVLDQINDSQTTGKTPDIFTTGLKRLDLDVKLKRGKLMVIGGRPSHGKSILAKTCLMMNALEGRTVLSINAEMNPDEQVERMISELASVHYSKIENKSNFDDFDYTSIIEASEMLMGKNMFFGKAKNITISAIKAQAINIKIRHGLDLVVVDYLQLLHPSDKKMPREQQVAEMARELKLMALELDIAVVLLAQLNRELEHRNGILKMPTMADLRESGAIEQDADIVLFTMIPGKYGITEITAKGEDPIPLEENVALTRVAKQRHGRTTRFNFHRFVGENVKICEDFTLHDTLY